MTRAPWTLALALLVATAGAIKIRTLPAPTVPASTPTVKPVPAQPAPLPAVSAPFRPTDPLYPQQWNLEAINMPAAWAVTRGAPVTVAVLDTGYSATPELAGRVFNGYDFVSDAARSGDGDGRDPDATDDGRTAYHATLVANLIAAAHDGRGLAGINPQARIVMVRVADQAGMIAPQDLEGALRWAAGLPVAGVPVNPRPARVINLSLFVDFIPLTGCDARVQRALSDVAARGVVVVSGAGNGDASAAGYTPAGCRNSLTVTASGPDGQRAPYGNYGASVTLAAPGGTDAQPILSSARTQDRRTGTSLAAPHVSGVVSLMLGLNSKLTPAQVRDLLTRSARPFAGGCDPDPAKTCGAGALDAAAALNLTRTGIATVAPR